MNPVKKMATRIAKKTETDLHSHKPGYYILPPYLVKDVITCKNDKGCDILLPGLLIGLMYLCMPGMVHLCITGKTGKIVQWMIDVESSPVLW